jgi:signal transduction histidine kinase
MIPVETTESREQRTARLTAELRNVEVFADLPDEALNWFVERSEERRFEAGEVMAREGDQAEFMVVILEGALEARREHFADAPYLAKAGQVTGVLPFSRLTVFPRTSRATVPSRTLLFSKTAFPELFKHSLVLGQRLVSLMADRIRETTRSGEQEEKLAALGRLSAGIAHELNNPAAAIQRSSAALQQALERQAEAQVRLCSSGLHEAQTHALLALKQNALQARRESTQLDSLARADAEDDLVSWIESRDIPDGWRTAGALVEAGVTRDVVERSMGDLSGAPLCDLLTYAAATVQAHRLAADIESSAGRITELVKSVKEYTYMDQATEQEIDVHDGLESTLVMLNHKLKHGVQLVREYDRGLPRICAHGSELNQVWTNLIDNAADAMQGKGELRIRTARDLDRVSVEIIDNGPGMAKDVIEHIFEPFFTTKPVGQGTGLGLDTVYRVVRKHKGEIRVESAPGRTVFRVLLPVPNQAVTASSIP